MVSWSRFNIFRYKNLVEIVPLAILDDLLSIAHCGFKSLEVNTFINTQIEMKRLRFHTPDANGKTKCHKMHVGRKNEHCPVLQVHGTEMQEVSSDVYLGDEISADGSNRRNILRRVSKGNGKISELTNMLEKTSIGTHYSKIAMLLRESIFLNSVLTNSEVWYGVTSSDINQLETVDKDLLSSFFKVPQHLLRDSI